MGDKESNNDDSFRKDLAEYRQSLAKSAQEMQASYDKGVLTLSGGAMGISFAFIKDVVGRDQLTCTGFLLWAWVAWAVSILAILASFYTSNEAIRKAISDTDARMIYMTLAKSKWARATKALNAIGGILFLVGVTFLVIFIHLNLHDK